MIARVPGFEPMDEDVAKRPLSPEVNQFLFTDVGVERTGMMLSVISLLSRRNRNAYHLNPLPQSCDIGLREIGGRRSYLARSA
jgi:hypothetical protein